MMYFGFQNNIFF